MRDESRPHEPLRALEQRAVGKEHARQPYLGQRRVGGEQTHERVVVDIDPAELESVARQELPRLGRTGRAGATEQVDGTSGPPHAAVAGSTLKLNIIPLSWCSAMWQCAIQRPGLVTSSRMSTVSPVRTRTVSFQTRLASGTPSRASTTKRPAPWTWNGWCIGWSESISLTSRSLTRSPTVNVQSIPWLAAPVSRSTSFQRMFA